MVTVIVGGQFGDEGKGKIVDVLAKDADFIVRYQGGANAGHTINVGCKQTILHLIPSGILYPQTMNVIGNGVVLDLLTLKHEIDALEKRGINFTDRLFLSDQAHVIFPWHRLLDAIKYKGILGTTGRGIGPAYTDKIRREGIRLGDFKNSSNARLLFDKQYESAIRQLKQECQNANEIQQLLKVPLKDEESGEHLGRYFSLEKWLDNEKIWEEYIQIYNSLQKYICNTVSLLHTANATGKKIVLEGAQGTFLDIDHGTYPYVTSSSACAGGACTGSGIGPLHIKEVCGIMKAYLTRVGTGPMPTELNNTTGEKIREIGHEYGATTKRPRRCGWFDAVLARHSVCINSMSSIALTKLDVLDDFDTINICVGYVIDGVLTTDFPNSRLDCAEPWYETLRGWKQSTSSCTSFSALPCEAQNYVHRLQEFLQCHIHIVSVGPERERTIYC